MGSRNQSVGLARLQPQELARLQPQELERYLQEIGEDPFESVIRAAIQLNKDGEGKSIIGWFMEELRRSAVEDTCGAECRLEIPSEFLLQHGDLLTPTVTFEKIHGNSWKVELTEMKSLGKRRVFALGKGGWRKFVEDNSLKKGDVVFLILKAKPHFRVVATRRPE